MDITLNNQNNQTITGTNNDDVITLNGTGDGNVVNALLGNDTVQVAAGSSYTNTTVNGSDGNENVSGFGSGSTIYGNKGTDTIAFNNPVNGASAFGGQDNDMLSVGSTLPIFPGNDGGDDDGGGIGILAVLEPGDVGGSEGTNVFLSGDAGSDTLFDQANSTGTTMLGGQDADTIYVAGTGDSANGNTGNDTIYVLGSNNVVAGGMNQDALFLGGPNLFPFGSAPAGSGNVLNGNKGNDTLNDQGFGGALFGGQDNDILIGSNSDTTLEGDLGNDLFVVDNRGQAEDDGFAGGVTTIADFVTGTDKVQLGAGEAATTANYSEAQVHGGLSNALGAARADGYTFVAGDTDGFLIHSTAGGVDSAVTLTGHNTLSSFAVTDIMAAPTQPQ